MARETMLNVLHSIGEIPDSNVLKECPTYEEANTYKKEQERITKDLDNLLNS